MTTLDAGRPAPDATRIARQGWWDARIILGNGEQLLMAIVIPVLALVGLATRHEIELSVPPGAHRVDVATPGVLALAVISTSFTGQAIQIAFDRRHGVLRLLATTPLGRSGLLAGRVIAVLVVQLIQFAVLIAVATALGWSPHLVGIPAAALAVLLGTTCFVSLGLLLGGTLRAEGVLALANLAWLVFALAGVLIPPPAGAIARLVHLLPSGALAEVLRATLLGQGVPGTAWAGLVAWTAVAVAAVVRFFRWDG